MQIRKYVPLFIGGLCLEVIARVQETYNEEENGETEEELDFKTKTSVLAIATVLISLSICFEFVKEKIEHSTSEEMKPVVHHLFQELTVLGFLSALSFFLLEVSAHFGNPLSTLIFGEEEEEKLSELIEYIHMGLFIIMVIFTIVVLLLIQLGEQEKRKWHNAEELSVNHQTRLLFNYEKALRTLGTGQDKFLWKLLPFLNPTSRNEENMNYFAIRSEFINPRDPTQPVLPKDFAFNMYMSFCIGDALGHLVDISPLTWTALEIYFTLLYLISFIPDAVHILYFLFGWLLLGWIAAIAVKLNQIKLKLIPRYIESSSSTDLSVNEGSVLLSGEQFRKPKFLELKLKRRSKLGRVLFGASANKQQLLFTGTTRGPAILLFNIRLILLLSSIYISALPFVCKQAGEWWYFFFLVPLSLLPIILAMFYMPRVLRLWVLVTSIEMLKRQDVINKVLRIQKTEKSLKTLKVIQVMRFKTRNLHSKDEGLNLRITSVSELSPSKFNTIREVFDLFDADGSGTIDVEELVEVFATLGQQISEIEAAELITSLDEDGDGELSFKEFAGYFQQILDMENEDTETMIQNMFSIFDRNENGEITTKEFGSVLQRLGKQLTADDIQAVIEEVDINGDGMISLDEFEVMVKKHLLSTKKGRPIPRAIQHNSSEWSSYN